MIRRVRTKVSHSVLAQTLQLLQQGDVTARQLCSQTGVHIVTAQAWLRALRDARTVHVCGWLPDVLGRDATPVYRIGAGTPEPRKKLTRAEISKRFRERNKDKCPGVAISEASAL